MALRRTESTTLDYWYLQEGTLRKCSKSMKNKSSKLYAKHRLTEPRGRTSARNPNLKRFSFLGRMVAETFEEQAMLNTGFKDSQHLTINRAEGRSPAGAELLFVHCIC